ncbi:helix-turn-helix domain-containing protein [Saccharospirillum mangrovi]|uniref:helix-turn-helix domain-containing protein n=1 Tax=Saccharospirillum mangrovi TaxID=2161747 RepID=UPI00130079EB|nr:helix-turn-helix domain-containing protein [Saccharospirillum mangrovi]
MNQDALSQPIQRHLDVVEIAYPRSDLSWTAPRQEWRHFAQCILLLSGSALAQFKGAKLPLKAPALAWLPAGMMVQARFSAGSRGLLLSISEDWLVPAVTGRLDPDLPYRVLADTVHAAQPDDTDFWPLIEPCFATIRAELQQSDIGARSVVAAQLTTLLTYLHRLDTNRPPHPASGESRSVVYQRFLQLVELHFREHWKVRDYAASMGVTERRLEAATQRDAKQSPSTLIQRKLLSEACQRLAHSPLSIAEVAYGLGFRDPAYFSRFFKRQMGAAPGSWRREMRAKEFHGDTTFAAWP